jgi:hypothetical protein
MESHGPDHRVSRDLDGRTTQWFGDTISRRTGCERTFHIPSGYLLHVAREHPAELKRRRVGQE